MGDGVWGIGDWGLDIGPNPQSRIPNPQSPIPNPHRMKFNKDLILYKEKFSKILTYKILNSNVILFIKFHYDYILLYQNNFQDRNFQQLIDYYILIQRYYISQF